MTAITTSRYAIFNGYNLNSVPGLSVYAIDVPGQQKKTLNLFGLARTNARKLSSAFLQSNTLQIGVYITAASRDLLEQALDTLYTNIQTQEATLTIPKSGTTRSYTATYESTSVNNPMTNTNTPASNYADLTLTFQCSDSYGYDIGPTLITNTLANTLAATTFNYTQGGSADTQVPIVTVRIDAITVTNPASIIIGNNANGQAITVNRTWAQYDLLVVDSQHNTVTVNGNNVTFTGAFPQFGLGAQTLTYNDTFTTRTVEIYANVVNRWN